MEGIQDKFKAFLSYKTEIFRLQNGNYSGPAEQIIDLSTQLCANIGIFPFFFIPCLENSHSNLQLPFSLGDFNENNLIFYKKKQK